MDAFDRKRFIPGFRGLLRDISEAGGPLVRLDELIDEESLGLVVKTIDMGMVAFIAGDTLFVSKGDFTIYREMVERIESGVGEAVEEIEMPMEMAE